MIFIMKNIQKNCFVCHPEMYQWAKFWRRRHLGDSPKECLKLSDGSDVPCRVWRFKIKIIFLKGVNLHSNAFHNIWQQLPGPPSPSSPPLSPEHLSQPPTLSASSPPLPITPPLLSHHLSSADNYIYPQVSTTTRQTYFSFIDIVIVIIKYT